MTPSQAVDFISKQKDRIITREVINLHSELQRVAPTQPEAPYSTGNFKLAWEVPVKITGGWQISNSASYASILWDGRRGNLGSKAWASGGAPVLKKYENRIEKEFKRIKA